MAPAKKKRFKVSTLVDVLLLGSCLFLLFAEISLVVSQKKDGIPSLFGKTFMRVLTGSMDGPDEPALFLTRAGDKENGRVNGVYYSAEEAKEHAEDKKTYFVLQKKGPYMLGVDTAAILEKRDFASVEVGDTVTFYYDIVENGLEYKNQLVSHRVIEKIGDYLYCYGDAYPKRGINYDATSPNYAGVQKISKDELVGVITAKSDFLGWFMVLSSSQWFVPVIVGVPLLTMGAFTLGENLKKIRDEKKEVKRRVEALVSASGVDRSDEAAYEREVEKATIKVEIQMEMEEEKEKQKAIYKKQFEKAKEEALKEIKEGKQ